MMTPPAARRTGARSLDAAILRIFAGPEHPVGAGFLVADDLALTCAHVVATALGIADGVEPPMGATIEIDLPLLGPAHSGMRATAGIERWVPAQDVAVLRLAEPMPGARPIRLINQPENLEDLWGHPARAFGVPAGHPGGVWHNGVLRAGQAEGWVEVDRDGDGHRIAPGFSGSPVWDDTLAGVVGIVVVAERGQTPAGSLIPTEQLVEAWPELRDLIKPPSPFRGLSAFQESDADDFYGRAEESEGLAVTVAAGRWTMLVGPSGCGKSSLVQAGVLPRLRAEGYRPVVMRPSAGSSPLTALAAALLPLREPPGLSGTEWDERREKLTKRLQVPGELADIVPGLLTPNGAHDGIYGRLLIVVDQFEELLSRPAAEIDAFAGVLFGEDLPECVRVLTTLRADYLEAVLTHPRLAAVVSRSPEVLMPMGTEQLREAITAPIDALPGVDYEGNLAERILDDSGSAAGALPLLEFTLDMLWHRQRGGLLTHQAYDDVGGVSGALRTYVDQQWEQYLRSAEYDAVAARRLLTKLVRLPIGSAAATRRAAQRGELTEKEWGLAQQLAATRLLVTGRSAEGAETVELAHEALISTWSELAAGVAADRAFLEWRESLRHDMARWQAAGRDPDLLPTRTTLAGAEGREHELNDEERAYIKQGHARRRARTRRRRALIGAMCVLALSVGAFGAVSARLNTDNSRAAAVTRANTLAADAAALAANDPGLAGQLAIAAYRSSPTQAAVTQLYATVNTPLDRVIGNDGVSNLQITAQSDGPLAAAVDLKGNLRVWNTANPAAPILDATIRTQAGAIALAPHSALMAAACPTTKSMCLWSLTDPRRPTVVSRLDSGSHTTSVVDSMAISPDGTMLAAAAENGLTFLWSIAQPAHPHPNSILANPAPGPHNDLAAVSFAPRGGLLATTIQDGQTELWNIAKSTAPSPVATITTGYQSVAFNPDGTLLAAAGDIHVGLWRLSDPAHPAPIDIDSSCPNTIGTLDNEAVAFSPDGARLAISGSDLPDGGGMLCTLSLDPGNLNSQNSSLPTATGITPGFGIQSMAYSATGALLTSGHDGAVRLWRWPLEQVTDANPTGDGTWAIDPSTHLMAAPLLQPQDMSQALGIWNLTTPSGPTLDTDLPLPAQIQSVQFLNESTLLTVTHDGATQLWDLHDPRHPDRGASLGTANFTIATNGYASATTAPAGYILSTGVTVDARGTLVAVAGSDNQLHLWRISNAQHATEVGSIPVPDTTADYAGTLADGRTVLITTPTRIDWWNIADPAHPKHGGTSPLEGTTLSNGIAAGNVFAAMTSKTAGGVTQSEVHLYEIVDGKPRGTADLPGLFGSILTTTLGISDDGDLLAITGAAGNTLTLWDTSNPTSPQFLSAIPAGQTITSIAFDPTGHLMIDWSSSSPVQVWEIGAAAAPTLKYSLTTPNSSVTSSIAFTPSGTMLAIAAVGGTISFFDTDPAKLAERLCSYTGATITTAQWAQSAPRIPYQNPCPL